MHHNYADLTYLLALLDASLLPDVVTGTSGGALVAAVQPQYS